ncbi:hypothetical protein [Bradyrhizobium sp. Ce-3]|uniref:hypothetical protein n=1 Tax=Bradyrhizobium sp. Ce-3 TaxID=2913970 RepID=UPI001FC8DF73|nr:hypothetical protein [Bradyrhizobium sp. Ce-3]
MIILKPFLSSCFDAFSSREPVAAALENILVIATEFLSDIVPVQSYIASEKEIDVRLHGPA